ncbi:MAG TPA: ferric reductase-like transmembrane domain-containing protein [Candidatus Saccharimonadales bacterium]|nr:ferric reductase-like transmembrane domain-containing protein [Candidatus Saccharimonadales bacterium]
MTKAPADKKQENMRTLIFSAFGLNAGFVFFVWLDSTGLVFPSPAIALVRIGGLFGLLSALSVLHQFVLQSRLPVLERYVGTPLIHHLHRYNGYMIFWLLIGHVTFVTLGHSQLHNISFIHQYIDQALYYPFVLFASFAFWLLMGVIIASITMVRKRLRYEYWYGIHLAVYAAILLGFLHQINNGATLLGSEWFKTYWVIFYILVLATVAYFRFIRLVLRYKKYGFYVKDVSKETLDTNSIYIGTKRPLPADFFIPGQFGIWRFFNSRLWWQAHPFTISSSSPKKGLRLTPKAVGDFTFDLKKIKPGTKLFFDGPHGVFTTERLENKKPLFIAGGIGITPIRAMLGGLGSKAKDAIIIHAVKTPEDEALSAELKAIAKKTGAKLHYVYSEKAPAGKPTGHISTALLKKLVPDPKDRAVALCGPPPMMDAVEQELTELGIDKEDIHTERFDFSAK